MNADFVRELLINNESELMELKKAENTFSKDDLGKYFSALSNEANLEGKDYAYLLFGVKDDKTIVGTNISDKQLDEYKHEIFLQTSPKCSFSDVKRIEIDGKNVIVFKIPSCSKGHPMRWKGHCYGRNGENLGALDEFEYENIKAQVREDWSSKVIPNVGIEVLDPEAIRIARLNYKVKNPRLHVDIDSWDDIEFLNKAKLTINGAITNAALLLLGKNESEYLISPFSSRISWILKDSDNLEKDYQHFSMPLLLSVSEVYSKIRNLKYRYIKTDSLFPEEVDQYDPYIIREALNNCIAHQDYTQQGSITVIEYESGFLTFQNLGTFIPENIENVIKNDGPNSIYRNRFLAEAMVNLNMIDTIGSGIKKMFVIQKNKFFPLPDYEISNNIVKVSIAGKVLDMEYAKKLAKMSTLSLDKIILLDKVSKGKSLTVEEKKTLRKEGLIEGKGTKIHISTTVALNAGLQKEYVENKGFEEETLSLLVIDYLKKFKVSKRSLLEGVIFKHLPKDLSQQQRKDKVKNLLQKLKRQDKIKYDGLNWSLKKK